MPGYVYLLQEIPHRDGESGPWTKIGISKNDPEWRINANLKRGNPRTLNLAAVFEYETEALSRAAETAVHARFSSAGHQKEWFMVDWREVDAWLVSQGAIRCDAFQTNRNIVIGDLPEVPVPLAPTD